MSLNGIELARMTAYAGIDLVAYAPKTQKAATKQIKTVREPKPGGEKVNCIGLVASEGLPGRTIRIPDLS